ASNYVGQIIDIGLHHAFSRRFLGRTKSTLDLKSIPFTALGVLLSADDEAAHLVKLQLEALQLGFFRHDRYFPIHHFLLNLMARYFNLEVGELDSSLSTEAALQRLIVHWQAPNASDISELCLAACDIHTRRCERTAG